MTRKILLSLGFAALACLAKGQDTPAKHLRFSPLGELPVWEERIENGMRVGQAPPPGSVPPKEVSIMSSSAAVPFDLGLRAFSKRVTISGETEALLLRKGADPQAPAWLRSRMPAAPLSLGVLYRDPATMSWNDPKMLLLKDDATSFPTGKIRFVNVSSETVVIMLGDPKKDRPKPTAFGLAPGKSVQKDLKVGKNMINVGYVLANGGRKSIWKNEINVLKSQRVQCFFYEAQDPEATDAVRFHFTPEPIPRIPPAPNR